MKRAFYYLTCLLLLTACSKDSSTTVTITGTLLLSTSNPVPVPDYVLAFCKSKNSGQLDSNIIGGTFFTSDITTNSAGNFEGKLTANESFSKSDAGAIGVLGYWNSGPQIDLRSLSFSNQDLGQIYLYKKVSRAIITVSTQAGIIPSDTLFTTVNTTDGYRDRAITNLSIPAGATDYQLDTASNVIFTRYSISAHQYYNDITDRKSGAASRFIVAAKETEGDEAEKVYDIAIP